MKILLRRCAGDIRRQLDRRTIDDITIGLLVQIAEELERTIEIAANTREMRLLIGYLDRIVDSWPDIDVKAALANLQLAYEVMA